jgi:hypothetical protein
MGEAGRKGLLTGCLNPIQLPATLNGTLIKNQINTRASIVVKGTAPLDPLAHRNRFSKKNVPKTIAGSMTGVKRMFLFHESPPNVL